MLAFSLGLVSRSFFSPDRCSLCSDSSHPPARGAQVREKSPGQPGGQVQPGVPLSLVLVYENGTEVHSQNILQMQADTQLVTNEQGRANLKVRKGKRNERESRRRRRRRGKERFGGGPRPLLLFSVCRPLACF